MENFVNSSFECVNGAVVFGTQLQSRSLVVFGDNGKAWNIAAKVRNTDKHSIVKALAKAVLAELRERFMENNTEAAIKANKKVGTQVSACLSGYAVGVTNKDGNVLADSILSVRKDAKDNGKLRTLIRFAKKQPIYKLVVEQGLPWTNQEVVDALNWWVKAAIKQMDYVERLDKALEVAANSNEKEEKAAAKEEKAAAKVA